jgi:hypothetical protein
LVDGVEQSPQIVHRPRVVRRAHTALEARVKDESVDALRVHGREQRGDPGALADAHQHRAFEILGVHHRPNVIGPLLQRRRAGERVREPAAALVEHRHPRE